MEVDSRHPGDLAGIHGKSQEAPMFGQRWRQPGMNGKVNGKADKKIQVLLL